MTVLALLLVGIMQAQTLAPKLQIPPAAQSGPQFNADAATRAYLDTLEPAKKARSDAYFEGRYWLILWDFLYGGVISLLLLATGFSARMRDAAEGITRRKPLQTWLYWAQYSVVLFVLGFPLSLYEGFLRERQYGLSNQTFAAWIGDQGKAFGLAVVLGGLAVVTLFGIVRQLPQTWHIWGAGAVVVFMMIGMLILPVFIAPMFNKYTLLSDPRIRDPILSLARQNGIPANNVYQVDASRQSKRVSANVSGFLGTERITLNDNLLNRCSPQAVMAVMGHEMGHYVLNHPFKLITYFGILAVVFFGLLRRALGWSLRLWGERWRVQDIGDPAVLPLVALILATMGFLSQPITNSLVRTLESEADIFGLNTSRQADGFAEAALVVSEYRKMEPGPIEEFIFYDHPSGRTRIYSAMRWKAQNQAPAGEQSLQH